jgi:anthranilate phosphoribosyltransferase
VKKQLIGTYHATVAPKLAEAMERLSTEKACVVHSKDGMDEVALSGETTVYEVEREKPRRQYAVDSSSFNLPSQPLSALRGGTPAENATIAQQVLTKQRGPARDVVLANAAFGIYVSGKAGSLREGSAMAAEAIDSGRAMEKLQKMVDYTNQ